MPAGRPKKRPSGGRPTTNPVSIVDELKIVFYQYTKNRNFSKKKILKKNFFLSIMTSSLVEMSHMTHQKNQ